MERFIILSFITAEGGSDKIIIFTGRGVINDKMIGAGVAYVRDF